MSRRLRMPRTLLALHQLACLLQQQRTPGNVLVVDGKPLEVSEHTSDPDARKGRGAGRFAKGYKLHAIVDPAAAMFVAWDVQPLNVSEMTVARRMLRRRTIQWPAGALLLGDGFYDSNPLHAAAARRRLQLVAPRRKPGTGLGRRRHHPNRLESIGLTEGLDSDIWHEVLSPQRTAIERFFAAMVCVGGGIFGLPPWVRRIHRVKAWVNAKICIHAARITLRTTHAA
jgi:hypothetical protein